MKVITVAAAIILNEAQQLLVVRKKGTSCFMQVGGKLEPNQAPEARMVRVIQEESGGQAQIEHVLGRFEASTANEPDLLLVSYVYWGSLDHAPIIDAEIAGMKGVDLVEEVVRLGPLTIEIVIPWVK